jgi:phage gp16-like protein
MKKEIFDELYGININPHIEQDYKGLSYLSWATAYKLAMDKDPAMNYEIVQDNDGMPFFSRGDVHIVKTKVTMFGETKEMFLPIMDNKHNAVANPNSRQVNDNIMRCLAKNIAMFGIGLPLYVGEDLAQFKNDKKKTDEAERKKKAIEEITKLANTEDLYNEVLNIAAKFNKNSLLDCTLEELKKIYTELKKVGKK